VDSGDGDARRTEGLREEVMYEYKRMPSTVSEDVLNSLGNAGWRLVHVTHPVSMSNYDRSNHYDYIFERPKKSEHEMHWRGKQSSELTWNDLCEMAEYLAKNY
jgi:hypothetical protein